MSISDSAVEAAARAAYDAEHETIWDQLSDGYKANLKGFARAALEAAAPHMRPDVQSEVLRHARAVIVPSLSTAETWRYDRVCGDFQEMIDAAVTGKLYKPTQ